MLVWLDSHFLNFEGFRIYEWKGRGLSFLLLGSNMENGKMAKTILELVPKVDVPEGESGVWKVERYALSDDDVSVHNIRCRFKPEMRGREIPPGTYTRLLRGWRTIMSDIPAERYDLLDFAEVATGTVLINGLGLGVAANAALLNPAVKHVTVVEISQDVIDLVADHLLRKYSDKIMVVHADCFEWKPPKCKRYNCVWHDVWDNICFDNLKEMTKLKRKYGRRCDWQACWSEELCRMGR